MKSLGKLMGTTAIASVLAFGAFAQDTSVNSGQGDAKGENSPSSSGVDNMSRGAPGVPQGSNFGTGRSSATDVTGPAHTRTVR